MSKTILARQVPEFMREEAARLQAEILQSRASSQSFFTNSVALTVGIISVFSLSVLSGILFLIFKERRKNMTFRDRIRKNDLNLIKKFLEEFYQAHGFYPTSQDSDEYHQVLAQALVVKKPLPPEEKKAFGQRFLEGILGKENYQKITRFTLDSSEVRDPKKGQPAPNPGKIFDYYYSTTGQVFYEHEQKPKDSYRLWCYLEGQGEKNIEGAKIYEVTSRSR